MKAGDRVKLNKTAVSANYWDENEAFHLFEYDIGTLRTPSGTAARYFPWAVVWDSAPHRTLLYHEEELIVVQPVEIPQAKSVSLKDLVNGASQGD